MNPSNDCVLVMRTNALIDTSTPTTKSNKWITRLLQSQTPADTANDFGEDDMFTLTTLSLTTSFLVFCVLHPDVSEATLRDKSYEFE